MLSLSLAVRVGGRRELMGRVGCRPLVLLGGLTWFGGGRSNVSLDFGVGGVNCA